MKTKFKIQTKKYALIIGGIILMFGGILYILNGLSILTPEHFEQAEPFVILIGVLIPASIGTALLIIGILLLKKVKLKIRK